MVVADSSPLNILIRIDRAALLGRLFDEVLVPGEVAAELSRETTPGDVRAWITSPPAWLVPVPATPAEIPGPAGSELGSGESAAIRLALTRGIATVLIDDRDARAAASRCGLIALGAVGVLAIAHDRGFTDLRQDFPRLSSTDFRISRSILNGILQQRGLPPL